MSDTQLTLEQRATNAETRKHIMRVGQCINRVIHALLKRAEDHDACKLESPEVEIFTKFTPKLQGTNYGENGQESKEYQDMKAQMKSALEHHYARSRHHPEHFENGVNDMNIIDLIELFCDWKAASERHATGNLRKSIEINANKFGICPQLAKILDNSIDIFDK